MTSLSVDLRDYFADQKVSNQILKSLNDRIVYCPILQNLREERDCGVIEDSAILFSNLNKEDRNEVFVYLGRILESVLTCLLASSFKVKKDRTSSGDVTIEDVIWEIKGTSGSNSWTGSTHATKKEGDLINFLGVGYGINKDADVFDILNGDAKIVNELFIGVFDQIKLIRKGSASDNSSRTQLYISVDDYDAVKNQVAWGNLAIPSGSLYKKDGTRKQNVKYLQLETAA